MDELKTCPFCGEKPIELALPLFINSPNERITRYSFVCMSPNCPIQPKTDTYRVREEAIAAWNTRAGDNE